MNIKTIKNIDIIIYLHTMVVPSAEYLMLCLNGILLLDEYSASQTIWELFCWWKSQSRECDDHTLHHRSNKMTNINDGETWDVATRDCTAMYTFRGNYPLEGLW